MHRTPRRPARAAVIIAVLAGLVLTPVIGALAAAQQRTAPPPAYSGRLPSASTVDAIFAGLDGGTRAIMSNRVIDVRTANCLYWKPGPKASVGRWAYYLASDKTSPYTHGLADPSVYAYKFSSARRARQAFGTVLRSVKRCAGAHSDGTGQIVAKRVRVPRIGMASFGYRERETQSLEDGTRLDDRYLTIWVRQRNYLIATSAQSESQLPGLTPLVRLTRATLRAAG